MQNGFVDRLVPKTVKQWLWLGAGVVGLIVLAMALQIGRAQYQAQQSMEQVVQQHLPATKAALALKGAVKDTTTALGFYLIDHRPEQRRQFEEGLRQLLPAMQQLRHLPAISSDVTSYGLVQDIEKYLSELLDTQGEILRITQDVEANMPAVVWARSTHNPLFVQILELIEVILFEEMEQAADPQHRQLLFDLAELRKDWLNISLGVRSLLIFRNDTVQTALIDSVSVFWQRFEQIAARKALMTLGQIGALEQIQALDQGFRDSLRTLIKLHMSPGWRRDTYLIQKSISPLVAHLSADLDALTVLQNNAIDEAVQSHLADIDESTRGVAAMGMLTMLLGLFSLTFLNRVVIQPLARAQAAMTNIAAGRSEPNPAGARAGRVRPVGAGLQRLCGQDQACRRLGDPLGR